MVRCEDAIRLMVVDNGLMDSDGGGIGVRARDWIKTGFHVWRTSFSLYHRS